MNYNNKWIRKFLRLAREACESTNCASRNVGCVLVRDKIVLSTGVNGPPPGCSNNSDRIYFRECSSQYDPITQKYIFDKTEPWYHEESCNIFVPVGVKDPRDPTQVALTENPSTVSFLNDFKNGKDICPRKLLNCKSGENLSICNCCHAESNAIAFAGRNGTKIKGASCFCFPISPCKSCAGMLISAGITEIYSTTQYADPLARIILNESKIRLFLVNSELLDLESKDKRIQTDKFVTSYN